MKVRFTRDVQYETEGRHKGPTFKKDSVHDLREDIAQRWIRRGAAEEPGNPISREREVAPPQPQKSAPSQQPDPAKKN